MVHTLTNPLNLQHPSVQPYANTVGAAAAAHQNQAYYPDVSGTDRLCIPWITHNSLQNMWAPTKKLFFVKILHKIHIHSNPGNVGNRFFVGSIFKKCVKNCS